MSDYIGADYIATNGVDNMYMVFVFAGAMLMFWIVEAIRRNEKVAAVWILLLPVSIIFYIVKYWEDTRGKLLFVALYIIVVLLIGGVADYNFAERIASLLQIVAVWPYHVGLQLSPYLKQFFQIV